MLSQACIEGTQQVISIVLLKNIEKWNFFLFNVGMVFSGLSLAFYI